MTYIWSATLLPPPRGIPGVPSPPGTLSYHSKQYKDALALLRICSLYHWTYHLPPLDSLADVLTVCPPLSFDRESPYAYEYQNYF